MRTAIVLLSLVLLSVVSAARTDPPTEYVPREAGYPARTNWAWFDDLEPGPWWGWTHGDYTTGDAPHFHVDAYMAFGGRGYSYWCGTFNYDTDGGYGNDWDDRLDLPPIAPATPVEEASWGAIKARYRDSPSSCRAGERDPTYPLLTFAIRTDSEPEYDFTYVQAESGGTFVNLCPGYDGARPWSEVSLDLVGMDVPYSVHFRFTSDGAWSDEDGLYNSFGGAVMCDEIRVWDYYSGEVHFYDDVEAGGLCTPVALGPAGDYWHIIENSCKAWSGSHCWANTSPDTNGAMVPPGVQNWLRTPEVVVSSTVGCTTYFIIQFFTPTVDNDYWTETVYVSGVGTQLHAWWGDQCDAGYGPCDHFVGGDDITPLLYYQEAAYLEWVYHTTDNGAGPDVCDCAGITLDDIGFTGYGP
jgi:hypothetical protein